ncbi:hypothetical protein JOC85_003475 [Bacillus mesophilus]|uniref:DNA-binding anti-repressor SinI n=1 Tax=Bacillus mesophilus TaxID=1808955 RepID=A0A6M0QAA9_9BACI|nr:anti-repressor SinI family protein [Bacillus mesophilus]MBM7662665.1 hypothetical protein [Bacillus mesophilus]NEY73272.1 DNA-binding anti-repressor SinI [Bacillus mesophilus]
MNSVEKLQSHFLLGEELDQEWVELVLEAIQLGLTKEEIREFLTNPNSIIHPPPIAKSV